MMGIDQRHSHQLAFLDHECFWVYSYLIVIGVCCFLEVEHFLVHDNDQTFVLHPAFNLSLPLALRFVDEIARVKVYSKEILEFVVAVLNGYLLHLCLLQAHQLFLTEVQIQRFFLTRLWRVKLCLITWLNVQLFPLKVDFK